MNELIIGRQPTETVLDQYRRIKVDIESGKYSITKDKLVKLLLGVDVSIDVARRSIRTLDLILNVEGDQAGPLKMEGILFGAPKSKTEVSVELNKDGTQSSSRNIQMSEEQSKDSKYLLTAHGYNPTAWEVVSARSSMWDAQVKDRGVETLYSSKITVKPKVDGLDADDIMKNFIQFSQTYSPQAAQPKQYKHGAECLVPCFYDCHFGKLASADECGENYDYKIARKRILDNAWAYKSKFMGRKFEKVLFVIGNDYFNSEFTGSTEHGTPQDNDTRYSKMFNKGVETLIEAIDIFASIAPVEVILVPGNHSSHAEFYASCVLKAWYRESKVVSVDNAPTTRKYRLWGANLLGFSHGADEKDRIFSIMQLERSKDWGKSRHREFLTGHLHHLSVDEKNGVMVRRIPTLSGDDVWTRKMGYNAKKQTACYVYDKSLGCREIHFNVI